MVCECVVWIAGVDLFEFHSWSGVHGRVEVEVEVDELHRLDGGGVLQQARSK